jgi:RNA polymerase sigma-70 factor (ECF subfamily)
VIDLDVHLPAVAAGDARAFGAWVAGAEGAVRDGLRGFAAAVDVEAVLQEALLRAWSVAPRLAPDGRANALLRFTVRAARNLALSEARRRGRVSPADDEAALQRRLDALGAEGPPPPDPLLRRLIEACRALLPRQPRAALDARLASGGAEPDEALAAGLGMQLNTFLQNFGRARRALLKCLADKGVDLTEARP